VSTLKVINNTAADVSILDAGLVIAASGFDVFDDPATLRALSGSRVLRSLLSAGTLKLNDGTNDVPAASAEALLLRCGYGGFLDVNYAPGGPQQGIAGTAAIYDEEDPLVTDSRTGYQGRFSRMQPLVNRRELFNDTDNPLYIEGFTPILGPQGWAEDHGDRIGNLETIHGKLGWHNQQVEQARYIQPKDLLIYYGWLNAFNSAEYAWNNEKVAQGLSKYAILVFGDGIQDPSHGDYSNTQVIIPRIKALNPSALIFGYVTVNQTLANFQTKAVQWNTLGVHGIFMDEAGYDYGKTRAEFNERVDYVHALSTTKLVFANAWNTDHILGTANDPSYPNSTYNPSLLASHLTTTDWALLESFPINTTAYSGTGGYEAKADWAARGVKMVGLRATYGVNFAACGVINNDNASGLALFKFGFVSSLMFSLEAWGTSDTDYGASSAAVKFWDRPSAAGLGNVWTLNPSVQNDVGDNDVYHCYLEFGHLKLDFSTGAQLSAIEATSGQAFGIQGPQGAQGFQGRQGYQGNTGAGTQGAQGPAGSSGSISTCKMTADVTNATVNLSNVTGLSFAVSASTDYAFQFTIAWSSTATTTGIRIDLTGPASPTELTWSRETMLSGAAGTDAYQSRALVAYESDAATASVDQANTRRIARITGVLRNGANAGTLQVRFAAETANEVRIYRGSWGLMF